MIIIIIRLLYKHRHRFGIINNNKTVNGKCHPMHAVSTTMVVMYAIIVYVHHDQSNHGKRQTEQQDVKKSSATCVYVQQPYS